MKAKSTIQKQIAELRAVIDDPNSDKLTTRVAYEVECALRWVLLNTVGWGSRVESVRECVELIRKESSGR